MNCLIRMKKKSKYWIPVISFFIDFYTNYRPGDEKIVVQTESETIEKKPLKFEFQTFQITIIINIVRESINPIHSSIYFSIIFTKYKKKT